MPKRSFVVLEDKIVKLLISYARTEWEPATALETSTETVKRRLKRLQEREAVEKRDRVWHWIVPERRE